MEATDSPVLIDVWTVDSTQEPELRERILAITRELIVGHEGFESAEVYESVDRTAVMIMVEMASIKDRQALTDSPEVHAALRDLREMARSHERLFTRVGSFTARG